MKKPAEIDIVRRAYELWQQAGEPEGKDQEFYHLAEQELRNADESFPSAHTGQSLMNKNCPAMASLAEELVGEFLFLMSKRRRSDLERLL